MDMILILHFDFCLGEGSSLVALIDDLVDGFQNAKFESPSWRMKVQYFLSSECATGTGCRSEP
jgi:hypothetical protein